MTIAADSKRLGAAIGFLAVRYTLGDKTSISTRIPLRGARWRHRPRWRALGRLPKLVFPAGRSPQRAVPQHLPNLLTAGLPARANSNSTGNLRTAGKTGRLRSSMPRRRQQDRNGWFTPRAPFGGPEQVLKYLARYTHPGSHLQQSPAVIGKSPSDLPMEGLRGLQPDQDHDAGRRRVHAALSAARLAARFCAHPSIWLPVESRPQGEVGSLSPLAERSTDHYPSHALFYRTLIPKTQIPRRTAARSAKSWPARPGRTDPP